MRKIIFVTTLGRTKDRLDPVYFIKRDDDGEYSAIFGISPAEAGIKYMLSQQKIDEIIVLGSPSGAAGREGEITEICDVKVNKISDLDGMSEYGFLCYRIAEFMNQIDLEMLDIEEELSDESIMRLKPLLDSFRKTSCPNVLSKDLFAYLSSDKDLWNVFQDRVLSECTKVEAKWIRHHLYTRTDSFNKMHAKEINRKTKIRFVPVETEGIMSIETISGIVKTVLSDDALDDSGIDINMDTQGLGVNNSNSLISTFLVMNRKTGYGCKLKGLISSVIAPEDFAGSVVNVLKSYEIQNLLSGIDIFLEYGKDSKLKEYWNTLGVEDADADLLFFGMDRVDEGISLCNVDMISYGINVIRNVINNPANPSQDRNIYLDIIMNAIRSDYGELLEGEELSVPELLKWSFRKGLYQQTLTIIESRVPDDIVKRGIYYYAQTEDDMEKFMSALNILYWNEVSKMRWSYNHPDHYFLKYYGRFAIDYRQDRDRQSADYARLRVDAARGRTEAILSAYSDLEDENLLYSLLYNYYKIGYIRNTVNHAEYDTNEKVSRDSITNHRDTRKILSEVIGIFISLYSMATEELTGPSKSIPLTSQRLKAYVRSHELKILEESSGDLTVSNSYSCQFSGKEVLIKINMLQNESSENEE